MPAIDFRGARLDNVSSAMNCTSNIEIKAITPALDNHPDITNRIQQVAGNLLPDIQFDFKTMTMGSEDMAYVMQEIPGCYVFIGSGCKEKNLDASHHHPRFDFEENILPSAVGLMVASTMEFVAS